MRIFVIPMNFGANGPGQFTSFGIDLHKNAHDESIAVYKAMARNKKQVDKIFVHASSKREWDLYGQAIGIADKIHHNLSPDRQSDLRIHPGCDGRCVQIRSFKAA